MAKIKKIKEGTATVYPATIPQAVIDPTSGKSVRTELNEKEAVANKKQTVTNSATDYPSGAAVTTSLALKTDIAELNKIYPLYNYNVRVGLDSGNIQDLNKLTELYIKNLQLLDSTVFLWSGVSGMKTRTSGSNVFASKLYNMANKVQQFGPELVTNGTFTGADGSIPAGWTGYGGTPTVDTNRLKIKNNIEAGFGGTYQTISTILGKTYHLSFSFIKDGASINGKISVATNAAGVTSFYSSEILTSSTSKIVSFLGTGGLVYINMYTFNTGIDSYSLWDNISVKQMDWIEGTNDAVQSTEANQPYVGGVIAPNEVRKLKGYVGSSDYVDFNPVVFASNSPWSVSFTAKNNSSKGNLDTGVIVGDAGSNTSWIGFAATEPNLRFRNRAGDIVSIPNLAPYGEIGKNGIYSLVSLGNNAIQVFKNSVLITTISVETGITIARIMDTLTSPNRQLNGELSHLQIHNRALSASEIQAQHDYLRLQIPEIEGIAIGNQYWQTSNYEGVVAGDGTVIPEVQGTSSTESELAVNGGFDTDTNWIKEAGWTIFGGTAIATSAISGYIIYQSFVPESGRLYKVTFTIVSITSGAIRVGVGVENSLLSYNSPGTYTAYIRVTTGNNLVIRATGTTSAVIDNFSAKKVGWDESTDGYTYYYNNTSGTAAQKELAALKAAAMWCYYNNDVNNGAIYGKLYNWYAVKLISLYPPQGWRVPTQADYVQLQSYLGGSTVAGGKMKALYGGFNNSFSTNESGFSAIGSGRRGADGAFTLINTRTSLVSTDIVYSTYNDSTVFQSIFTYSASVNGQIGASLRLLRNSPVGPNERTITSTTIVSDIASTANSTQIPFGYSVASIQLKTTANLTNIKVELWNNFYSGTPTLVATLITGKTANNTTMVFPVLADCPSLLQDGNLRVTATGASGAETVVEYNLQKNTF